MIATGNREKWVGSGNLASCGGALWFLLRGNTTEGFFNLRGTWHLSQHVAHTHWKQLQLVCGTQILPHAKRQNLLYWATGDQYVVISSWQPNCHFREDTFSTSYRHSNGHHLCPFPTRCVSLSIWIEVSSKSCKRQEALDYLLISHIDILTMFSHLIILCFGFHLFIQQN